MKKYYISVIVSCIVLCLPACNAKIPLNNSSKQIISQVSQSLSSDQEIVQNFKYQIQNNEIVIIHYMGKENIVSIPSEINKLPVTVLGEDAFYEKTEINAVKIPNSITTLRDGAFYRCYNLKSVFLSSNVRKIGSDPFFRCSSLTTIVVDKANQNYCDVDGVLFNKSKTELIEYPEGKLQEQYCVPSSVKVIKDGAFGYSSNLKTISIPPSVTEMPNYNIVDYPDHPVTLVVSSGSYAEFYAKKYKVPFTVK